MRNTRQISPAIGQRYWFAKIGYTDFYTYNADHFDFDIVKLCDIYPEDRLAEAELRAKELIRAFNKRRRELNEGKEFGDRSYYVEYWDAYVSVNWEATSSKCTQGVAYPFGLFKDSSDCEMCVREFEDELEWFSEEYLPLMTELDEYDWADAPDWQE